MARHDKDGKQLMIGFVRQPVPTRGVRNQVTSLPESYFEWLLSQAERRMRDARMRNAQDGMRSIVGSRARQTPEEKMKNMVSRTREVENPAALLRNATGEFEATSPYGHVFRIVCRLGRRMKIREVGEPPEFITAPGPIWRIRRVSRASSPGRRG
jgi:hypothetical protein